jgi:complement component 1 Q subcomponent-binding protein
VQQFLKENPDWQLVDADGDVNLKLTREVGDKLVAVEWQLVSPFNPAMQYPEEGTEGQGSEEDQPPMESTDFTITVSDKTSGGERGIIFYCSTAAGEGEHEYVIGNVRSFSSSAERDSVSAYNGPDFEDLNEEVQQSLDEYLASLGINEQVRLFVDTAAIDKEQREYNRWLSNVVDFLKH